MTYFEGHQITIFLYGTVSVDVSCKVPLLSSHDSYHSQRRDKRNINMAVSVTLNKWESMGSVLHNSTGGGIGCLFVIYLMML
jgi:hypothetical protein